MKKFNEWVQNIQEYENHVQSLDGEPFNPKNPSELFNQLKLMETATRRLAQQYGVTSNPVGRALSKVEEEISHCIGVLANAVDDKDWQ